MGKRILNAVMVCGVLLLVTQTAQAQQDPYYTHFKFNRAAYNAGAIGEKDDYICLTTVGHNQWLGFDDRTWIDRNTGEPIGTQQPIENVAPVTINFNISGQLPHAEGREPFGAVGLSVFDDRLGFMKTTSYKIQGAYFIPIQGNFGRLSLGVDAGFTSFGYVNPQFRFRQAGDPRIPTSDASESKFDLGFGAFYTQKRLGPLENFYTGLSLSHLNGTNYHLLISPAGTPAQYSDLTLAQHVYFLTGGEFNLGGNPALVMEPAVLIKYNTKLQIDLSATVLYNQTLRGGLGYRQWGTADAISIMLGYVKDEIQVGYSYDITLSKVQSVSNGTHEIFLKYCFSLKVPPPPPSLYLRGTREL